MDDILSLAREYSDTYAIAARGHHLASARAARWNKYFGVPVTVVTTIIGTSIFATINESLQQGWRIAAGLLSLAAALLSSLQTFFGYSEVSRQHKVAATRYSAIRRNLECFELKYAGATADKRPAALSELEAILQRLEELAEESPTIPDNLYYRAEKEFKATNPDRRPKASA
jgi:hypothetical protein